MRKGRVWRSGWRRHCDTHVESISAPMAHQAFHPSGVGTLVSDSSGRIVALARYIGRLSRVIVKAKYVTLSHISSNAPFVPQARLNDDRIYLTYILRKDIPSRLSLIKFLIAIESQKHLKMPFVKVVEVGAFRLEPLVSGSYIVVDGEVVEATKIQAVTSTLKMAFCTLAGK
uniref:Cache domain-containing protein n=1 Tax=Angiostrongylus cantonensis TaxID=6313 RepID=A0A0K0CYP0_ANGCA